jgi:type II secretion system protein H
MSRGLTLPEMLTVLMIMGITAAIVAPPLRRSLDRAAVDDAADRYASLHEEARQIAVARGRPVRVELDTASRTATIAVANGGAWDTLQVQALGTASLSASRVVVTFSPLGIGFGASNTRVVIARGAAAETLTVSRTGRLRRS